MINLLLYNNSIDTISNLICNTDEEILFICPSPSDSDTLRKVLIDIGQYSSVNTINTFAVERLREINSEIEITKKSDLILELSVVWQKIFPGKKIDSFFQSFDLLTELRGFTLDFSLVEDVLALQDEYIKKSVLLFWRYINERDLIDEHACYGRIIDNLRENQELSLENKAQNIIFFGFTNFSGIQLDFVKALGIINDVYIPIPEEVYDNRKSSDWISWFESSQIIRKISKKIKKNSLNIMNTLSDKLSDDIKIYLQSEFNLKSHEKQNIVFPTKEITFGMLNEVPTGDIFFQEKNISFDLVFCDLIREVKALLLRNVKGLGSKELKDYLSKKMERYRKNKQFSLMSVSQILIGILDHWCELWKEQKEITTEELKLFEEIGVLNLPRVKNVTLIKEKKGNVLSIRDLSLYSPDQNYIFCLSKNHNLISITNTSKFPQDVLSLLASLGPLKSIELESNFFKSYLSEIVNYTNSVFIVDPEVENINQFWSCFFNMFEKEVYNIEHNELKRKGDEFISCDEKEIITFKNISSSRLQSFIDCQKKYYFEYIKKICIDKDFKTIIPPHYLGQIEHKVLERYFNEKIEDLDSLIINEIDSIITREGLILKESNYKKHFNEVKEAAQNGISVLKSMRQELGDIELVFEYDLKANNSNFSGRVDCVIIKEGKTVGILDFKRSESSIPGKYELLDFKKIQLWFYQQRIFEMPGDGLFAGYINLARTSDSLFIVDNNFSSDWITTNFTYIKLENGLTQKLHEYHEFESKLIVEIGNTSNFKATAINKKTCIYCPIRNFCEKDFL